MIIYLVNWNIFRIFDLSNNKMDRLYKRYQYNISINFKQYDTTILVMILSQKQLEKLVMNINDGKDSKVNFELTHKNPRTREEVYETKTGAEDVYFTLKPKTLKSGLVNLTITVGGYVIGGMIDYSKTEIMGHPGEGGEISNDELKLIKSLIKNFTESIGNPIYIK